jgi:hypothetical protein
VTRSATPEVRARTGAALGLGALVSLLAVSPALLRIESDESSLEVWIALAGGSALVLGPVVALLAVALQNPTRLLAPLSGVALSAAPLALLGLVLKTQTHHRPLGAATFAVLAFVVVSFCVVVALRIARAAEKREPSARRALLSLLVAGAFGSLSAVLVTALRGEGLRPHVLDGMSLIVAGGVALGALRLERVRLALGRVGPALWTILVFAGVLWSPGEDFVPIKKSAPVVAGPRAWL